MVAAVWKGLIRELIALASVLAGLVVAALGYRLTAVWFEDLTRSHEVALGVAFLALFVATLLVGVLVSILARRLVKTAGLEWFDRFLGGVFGLVRGVAIDCVFLMALVAFGIKSEAVQASALAPYVVTGARVLVLAMPGEMQGQFGAGFEKFHQAVIERDRKASQR
jgi:membrane protein required for colicin V production